jgi:hypothetical protein
VGDDIFAHSNDFIILGSMKKIPISTLFIMLAVPFIVVTGFLMTKSKPPLGAPKCYKELICDTAQILDASKLKHLEDNHKNLLDQYDIDLRVLVGNMSAGETVNYFKAAKIGDQSKEKNGALLMVDPQSALVRFHASPSLRKIYTDGFVSYLEVQQMNPFFENGKVSLGIVATSDVVTTRVNDAAAGKPFVAADYSATAVQTATGKTSPKTDAPAQPDIQRPTEIVSDYHRVLVMGNTAYDLPIYSRASKISRMNAPQTVEQMNLELKLHQPCSIYKEVVLSTGLAALLYDASQRQCSPYFLVFENGAWRLDFPAMAKYIRINKAREWSLDMKAPSMYTDALLDYQFDQNGVPHPLPPMRWGLLVDSDVNARVTYIKKIFDKTPAAEMQLKEQDVLLKWDSISNPTHADIEKSMESAGGGQKINILLWRNGQRYTLDIVAPPRLN